MVEHFSVQINNILGQNYFLPACSEDVLKLVQCIRLIFTSARIKLKSQFISAAYNKPDVILIKEEERSNLKMTNDSLR